MGALAALATAARFAERVEAIALIAVGGKNAGASRSSRRGESQSSRRHRHGGALGPGRDPRRAAAAATPGLWMLGGVERLLERAAPGVLHADLFACNAYAEAESDAARVDCPRRSSCSASAT